MEDSLAERGITVSRESMRLWCIKFGPEIAQRLRCNRPGYGDTFFSAVYNVFNLGRHLVRASHYRDLRQRAFASWSQATAA